MKKLFSATLLCSALLSLSPAHASSAPIKSTGTVDVYFSPRGGCTEAVVREIDGARREILVQAYSFTSQPIAQAIVNAAKRGVRVVAVLDKSQRGEKYTEADFLAHMRIPTLVDDKHAIAHNKIIIIDRSTLITGSFNFTKSAEEKKCRKPSRHQGEPASGESLYPEFRTAPGTLRQICREVRSQRLEYSPTADRKT